MSYRHRISGTVYTEVDKLHPRYWRVRTGRTNGAWYIVKSKNVVKDGGATPVTGLESTGSVEASSPSNPPNNHKE